MKYYEFQCDSCLTVSETEEGLHADLEIKIGNRWISVDGLRNDGENPSEMLIERFKFEIDELIQKTKSEAI